MIIIIIINIYRAQCIIFYYAINHYSKHMKSVLLLSPFPSLPSPPLPFPSFPSCSIGVWTQGFAFVKEALYSFLFVLVILVLLFPQSGLCYNSLISSFFEITGTCHHFQLFSIVTGSHKHFCLGWPWTLICLILSLCIVWDDRHMPPCWVMGSLELFAQAGLELQASKSQPPK
jgi:hypothetical protein